MHKLILVLSSAVMLLSTTAATLAADKQGAFLAESADLSAYNKVYIVNEVNIAYKNQPGKNRSIYNARTDDNFPLSDKQFVRLQGKTKAALVKAFSKQGFVVVDAPADDVLTLQASITDLRVKVPHHNEYKSTRQTIKTAYPVDMVLVAEFRNGADEVLARVLDSRKNRNRHGLGLRRSSEAADLHEINATLVSWANSLRARLSSGQLAQN